LLPPAEPQAADDRTKKAVALPAEPGRKIALPAAAAADAIGY
jgi:hypothetical protein